MHRTARRKVFRGRSPLASRTQNVHDPVHHFAHIDVALVAAAPEPIRCVVLSPGADMRRREFLSVLGGAAAGWPLAARAQQDERVRRIGALAGGVAANDPDAQANIAVFLQALQQLGWIDGRNVQS